ncbi:hypothetical protein HW130_03320 [Streptomyces sp. PKU-EA00015]|uniref:hypothetical protein n=1 Tax=Streptomyces sp. PKU-EA00015 TaxID=2748326 RepID=UPI00159FAC78|nr:hypothetical protein [Streptomyces sp. PKU-EA00015]NWF25303.1 hypothetical protein [Streptomyces sp. PKU-EA00015]
MSAPRDLDRLAKAVKARRLQLHPSRLAAANAAGVSKDTWQRVEEGLSVRDVSYAKMDPALGWVVGSCMLIADGGDPVPVVQHEAAGSAFESVSIPPSLLPEDVRGVVTDAAMATTPGLTVREIQELSDKVVEELRKRGILPAAP